MNIFQSGIMFYVFASQSENLEKQISINPDRESREKRYGSDFELEYALRSHIY